MLKTCVSYAVLGTVLGLATVIPALAQSAPAGAVNGGTASSAGEGATRQGATFDDIVVTAQKRAENVQKVPISIAAVAGAQLEAARVTKLTDMGRIVPGFSQQPAAQATNIRLSIRGVGASTSTGIEPAVATFLDDVYIPRPGSLIGRFYDIDTVEILRGPQGTLFGRNASAGAINIRTRKPTDEFEGYAAVEASSYRSFEGVGAVNTPFSDKAALRVAVDVARTGGPASTSVGDRHIGKQRSFGSRATLKLEPTDRLTWLIRGDYLQIRGDGAANTGYKPDTVTATGAANYSARLGGIIPDFFTPFDRRNSNFVTGFQRDRQYGLTSDLTYSLDNGFDIRLINAYRNWRTHQVDGDIIFTPIDLVQRDGFYASKSQSHELQLISPKNELMGGRLNFVAGLYYFREKLSQGEDLTYSPNFCNLFIRVAAPALLPACTAGPLQNTTSGRYAQKVDSVAAYGQADYKITDKVTLLLGGRYTHDKKDGNFVQRLNNAAGALFRTPETTVLERSEGKFTYRVNLSYEPKRNLLFYANYTTGFKSGGFNAGGGTAVLGQRRAFDPETVKDTEIGAKTTLAGGLLTLNANLFRMEVSDLQDRAFDGTSLTVTNAGKLRQQGLELDSVLRPTPGLRLSGSVTYLDSEFLSYPAASNRPGVTVAPNPGTAPGTQNLKGARATFSPKWQGNVAVQYDTDIGSSGYNISFRTDVSFVTDSNIGLISDNNPQTIQKGYQLVSGRISLTSPDERWTASIFGDNLFDKGYCSSIFGQTLDSLFGVRDGRGNTMMRCTVGSPRSIGARIEMKF
nr:TonB-dependent receptor [Sphingomonas sp. CDS-1]